jgi:hypothetical protein
MNADALSATPAARAALEALRAAAGLDSPLERHCLRQFAIAERLASERAFDRELLLCALPAARRRPVHPQPRPVRDRGRALGRPRPGAVRLAT